MKSLLLLLSLLPGLALAKSVYVKSKFLKIYEKPSRSSNIVNVANKGDKLSYLKKNKGMYVFVRKGENRGWAIKHSLSKKPLDKVAKIKIFKGKKDICNKSQKVSSDYSAGGVVSGFSAPQLGKDKMTLCANGMYIPTLGEFDVILQVPKDEAEYKKEYGVLEVIMNNQIGMSEAKEFIK